MMTMMIMMIKNWLHFGYSDRDMQEEKYVSLMSDVVCVERLAGLLKSYHRKAA